MTATAIQKPRSSRSDSRRTLLRDQAAWLFRQKGYYAASVRDIAADAGMLPGSLYCHFSNKEDLLVEVYEAGIREISEAVQAAVRTEQDPWQRFESACCAHLDALLKSSDYPMVVVRVLPDDVPKARVRLIELRNSYESIFEDLIAALPLALDVDRGFLRRLVIGALNSTTTWYRPRDDSPRTIARKLIRALVRSLEGEEAPAL